VLLLRPEKLEILTNGQGENFNCFTGRVKDLVYQGESFLLYVELDDGAEVTLRSPTRREVLNAVPPPGSPITLGLHPEDTIVVGDGS
jgi:putative spermidine/putrescine transport system ATP-binding protein